MIDKLVPESAILVQVLAIFVQDLAKLLQKQFRIRGFTLQIFQRDSANRQTQPCVTVGTILPYQPLRSTITIALINICTQE